jgi:hypothetical protein
MPVPDGSSASKTRIAIFTASAHPPRDQGSLSFSSVSRSLRHPFIRKGKALADVVTISSNRPSLESYTLAGEVTGEKAKRTRYGERRWAFVV